jgi:hypothetical protein
MLPIEREREREKERGEKERMRERERVWSGVKVTVKQINCWKLTSLNS